MPKIMRKEDVVQKREVKGFGTVKAAKALPEKKKKVRRIV